MAFVSQSQLFFIEMPIYLGRFGFVGLPYIFSILMLWLLTQGLVWLAERYSRMLSSTAWWRSGLMALLVTFSMVLAWSLPAKMMGLEIDNLVYGLTATIIVGGMMTWFLTGSLYSLEFTHRAVLTIGVPIMAIMALAVGANLLGGYHLKS